MAHGKIDQALKSELDLIERRLFTLRGYRLLVCELRMQMCIAAARMGIEAPQERRREAYLTWLGMHWESVEGDFIELKRQKSRVK
jgi:hypothetical protein